MVIFSDLYHILTIFSFCLDFGREGLSNHHRRVAYIALNIADELGLSDQDKNRLFMASIIHDAGVSTWKGKQLLSSFEINNSWGHCKNGFDIARKVNLLKPISQIILCHHDNYSGDNHSELAGNEIPLAARIIHLADRIDVLVKEQVYILYQKDSIVEPIERLTGQTFDPEVVKAFMNLARRESFWLGLTNSYTGFAQGKIHKLAKVALDRVDIKQISEMFATVIDRKNPFTLSHSIRVTGVATKLAKTMGLGGEDLYFMEIAGLLHDLGKLSIPDEILDKPGALTKQEFALIRQHTYHTYNILKAMGAPAPIPEWAAYHHEKLDGDGYPFRLDASQLSTGSRIIAVADVFTALREDRPYRAGLNKSKIEDILVKMVVNNALDREIVKNLFDIYDEVKNNFGLSSDAETLTTW